MVYVRVGDARNLTLEQGARDAELLSQHLMEALELTSHLSRGAILDVSKAPSIAGPRTRKALSRALLAWQRAGRPLAFVVGNDPIKHMQYVSLVRQYAPGHGKVVADQGAARDWCREFAQAQR